MIHFSLEEKLAIVAACTAAIALFATIMACKLSPTCFMYGFCPIRPAYDDDDEEMAVKVKANNHEHKGRYKLIDYKTLLPAVPSIKVTTLDETSTPYYDDHKQAQPAQANQSDEVDLFSATWPSSYLARPLRRSNGSISGSSTGSSEHLASPRTRLFPRLRKYSGSGTISSDGDDPSAPASIEVALQYNEAQEKLTIVLHRARRIPPNVYGGANDSYVQVIVGKDRTNKYWRRRSDVPVDDLLRRSPAVTPTRARSPVVTTAPPLSPSEKSSPSLTAALAVGGYSTMAEFQSRVIRKDADPVFKERFVVDDVKAKEKRYVWIKFILHSIDRFSHEYVVGTKQIGLDRSTGGVDLEPEKFTITTDRYMPNLGDMTLSLCYMPTAARLVVTVERLANLRPPDGLEAANPYMKAVILRRGKVLEKHTTTPRQQRIVGVNHHTFADEPLVFDVPPAELEKIVLLLTVAHHHDDAHAHSDGDELSAASSSDGGFHARRGRSISDLTDLEMSGSAVGVGFSSLHKSRSNSCMPPSTSKSSTPLGRLAFGSLAAVDPASKRHWAEMIRNPRKQIVQTHKLRP